MHMCVFVWERERVGVTSSRRSTPWAGRRGAWWQGRSRNGPAAFAWPDDSCWTHQCSGRGNQTPCRHTEDLTIQHWMMWNMGEVELEQFVNQQVNKRKSVSCYSMLLISYLFKLFVMWIYGFSVLYHCTLNILIYLKIYLNFI